MDYLAVYTNAFNTEAYSSDHHIQYDYIVNNIVKWRSPSNKIVDVGSGRGQVIKLLNNNKHVLEQYSITSVDLKRFHNEACDRFIECDISKEKGRQMLMEYTYDTLVCSDVLEHLDVSYIEDVIRTFANMSKKCILTIANHSDILHGVELHTIQKNDIWWEELLSKYFTIQNKEVHYNGRLYHYICINQ